MKCLTAGKQSFNALKNRWLGRVAARVALERPAEGFKEGFEVLDGGQTELQRREKQMAGASSCDSCFGKACGRV